MTTIVWDPYHGALAADTRVSWNGGMYQDGYTKIFEGKDFHLAIGGAISVAQKHMYRAFNKVPLDQCKAATLVQAVPAWEEMLKEDNSISMLIFLHGRKPVAMELYSCGIFGFWNIMQPYGVGTGAQFAMGAVSAGVHAEGAVRIASNFDALTSPEAIIVNPFDNWEYKRGD